MDALNRSRDQFAPLSEVAVAPVPEETGAALARAVERLLSLQDSGGWWKGELETNVTMDAEDMLLREFLGIRHPEATARSAGWIRSQQRADGTWSNFYDGPADLSTTIEAYVALRLAGDSPADEHMRLAAEYVRGAGGLQRARVFTHIWLALFGAWPWTQVPALPPELILLPAVVSAERLRLRLLGAADGRRAVGRAVAAAGAAAAVHARRARRPRALVAARRPPRDSAARWWRSTGCFGSISGARWRRCADSR